MRPRHHRARLLSPAVLAATALALPMSPTLRASAASAASVSIADSPPDSSCGSYQHCYDPGSVHVDPGGTVTWTSNSAAPHTVTADDGSFASGSLAASQTYKHTYPTSGTFTYKCTIHSYMHGTVVVGSGSPPSTQAPPSTPSQTSNPVAPANRTAAPTATPRPATALTPTSAATTAAAAANGAASPTAAPVADASTPAPSPSGDAGSAPTATTTPTSSGGGTAPILVAVAGILAAAAGGAAWWRRRKA